MNPVQPEILRFIAKHRLLTLATTYNDEPWCAHCFYAYLPEQNVFVFHSDSYTLHIEQVSHNCYVAGSVVLESWRVGRLRGLQLQGVVMPVTPALQKMAEQRYKQRFPVARLMNLKLWQLDVTLLKYTDNRLGFGKKLLWRSDNLVDDFFRGREQKQ